MDDGITITGWGTSSTSRPSSLQTTAPKSGPMPPRISIGAPQSSALASSSAPLRMNTRTHTVPCYIDDDSPVVAVSLLLQGKNVDQEDQHGNTPLMHLVGRGQFDAARLLIDAGADPSYRNHAGDCAVDLAMAQGEYLEAAGLADKAASAAGTAVTALLGRLNRRIAVSAKDDTTSSSTTTTVARVTVPAASFSPVSMTSMTYTMEDAFKAVVNNDLAAPERILPTPRRSRQGRRSQQHVPARSGSSRVRIRILKNALLKMAACLGRSSLIPALLDSGALLEHVDGAGDTALILAAKHGHAATVNLLLQAGADMEHADAAGWTALVHAAHVGNDEVASMLVARGANLAARNKTGALLMALALKNSGDVELRSLSRRALKQRTARKPSIPVTVAPATTHELLSKVFRAVEKKDAQLLRQLLAQTSNYTINIKRELCCLRKPDASKNALLKDRMMTPLMLAAFSGDEDSLQLLLDSGADIAQSDSSGMTALMWAARGGHTAAVAFLLGGGKVNQADAFGATALILAVDSRVAATVQALVEAGAKLDHATKDGRTALMYAAKIGNTAIIKILLRAGAKIDQAGPDGKTALFYAAKYGHTSIVKDLLKAKTGVDRASKDGWTALMLAAAKGYAAIVKLLLQAGAKTNLNRPRGMTALMYAAESGHIGALRSLLQSGAAIDQVNDNGASALMCAAYEGQHAAVKVLLEAGANFRLEAEDVGYTALRIARMRQHFESVELLRAKGADT
jgi:ankyrin repeat protein